MHNQAFLAAEKAALLAELTRVQDELNRLQEAMRGDVNSETDEGDAEIVEHARNRVLIGVLERRLQEINAGLRALDQGVYGICERCAEPIETERLQAKPDAILCLRCQSAVEAIGRRHRVPPRSW